MAATHALHCLPDFFAGQPTTRARRSTTTIEVVDTANHLESIDESITVAEKAPAIGRCAESGMLPGLETAPIST